MNKANVKLDVLKKTVARLVKAAPARKTEPLEPLARIIRAFMEYDCDEARTVVAERKILENMVDFNELRVTPAIELAALLGVRYPFAESRCSALHRTLQSIFDREHHMRLERIKEMKKGEIRPYFQSLAGITPYVEAAVSVDCFGIHAAPVDTKVLLWLISKDALPEGTDIRTAQGLIEKVLKAGEAEEFFHGSRREIDDWVPRSWPQVAKVPSPILAPPPIAGAVGAAGAMGAMVALGAAGAAGAVGAVSAGEAAKVVTKEGVKEVKKAEPVKAEAAKSSAEAAKKAAAAAPKKK